MEDNIHQIDMKWNTWKHLGALVVTYGMITGGIIAMATKKAEGAISDSFNQETYQQDETDERQNGSYVYDAQKKRKTIKVGDYFSARTQEQILTDLIYGEARGIHPLEQRVVGLTTVSRAKDNKKWNGTTIKEAALTPWQYSCFNLNDPNRPKIMKAPIADPATYAQCNKISKEVITNPDISFIEGATHYHRFDMRDYPTWTKDPRVSKLGRIPLEKDASGKVTKWSEHIFYREN